jgi:antigen flippase
LPGLLGTLAFAPWLIHVFYSARFLAGAELLPWFVVGVFGQVLTWPLGFIQRAKGRAGWFFICQSQAGFVNLALALILIPAYGVIAAAWAFVISTYVNVFVSFAIAYHLSRFTWTAHAVRLGFNAISMIGLAITTQKYSDGWIKHILGLFIVSVAGLFSLRGIASRLGVEHKAVKFMLKLPGGRLVSGL